MNMDNLAAQIRANRGPACIARDGSCQRTPQSTQFRNALLDWHDAGKPISDLAMLKAREIELRANNKY